MLARSDDKPLRPAQLILLFSLAWLLPLLKPPYVFLAGMVFLIPVKKIGSRRKYFAAVMALLIGAGVLFVVSSNINRDYYFSNLPFPGVEMYAQIAFVLEKPVTYIKILLATLSHRLGFLAISYIGLLGWLDTLLPGYVYWTYPLVVTMVILADTNDELGLSLRHRLVVLVTGLTAVVVVATGQYVRWTPVKSPLIWGIQGRHFIPIIPVLLVAFYNRRYSCQRWILAWLVPAYLAVMLSVTLSAVVNRFYRL
jgi:uncharacterized membrane protein